MSETHRDYTAKGQHHLTEQEGGVLADLEQPQWPLLAEVLYERQVLGLDLLLRARTGLEVHDAPPKLVADLP